MKRKRLINHLLIATAVGVTAAPWETRADYPEQVLMDDPLVYYRFEETSGAKAVNQGTLGAAADGDYSPTGLWLGEPSAAPALGSAVWVDGMNGYIGVPQLGQPLAQLTLEMWLQRTYDWPDLTALYANDGWAAGFLHLNLVSTDDDPLVEFAVNGNPLPFPRFAPEWQLEEWHHLLFTYDSAASPPQLRFYFDGALHSELELSDAAPVSFTGGRIGMWGTARQLEGTIDEFAIYPVVLSPDRVAARYNAVFPEVRLVTQPSDQVVLRGEAASFRVGATGAELAYQWYRNGEAIPGATAPVYGLSAQPADTGSRFSVQVSNPFGSVFSAEAVLTVISEVSILTQPEDQYTGEGYTAVFRVVAQGPDRGYQWYRNGQPIEGATESTYTTGVLTLADEGAVFTVTVRNDVNSVTSQPARLTVFPIPTDAYGQAVIADQPLLYYRLGESFGQAAQNLGRLGSSGEGSYADSGVEYGQPSAFPDLGSAVWLDGSAGHIAVPALDDALSQVTIQMWLNRTYEWPGLTALLANDLWQSGALHLNLVEATPGPLVEFAVNGNPTAPRFTPDWEQEEWYFLTMTYDAAAQPGQLKFYLNGALHSQAEIAGAGPMRWTGGRIGMWQTSRQLEGLVDEFALYDTVLSAERIQAHYHTVQRQVAIMFGPQDVTVERRQPVTFQVVATGPNREYQWYQDGQAIAGATAAEYTIAAAATEQNGARFSVQVRNQQNTVTSAQAVLTVISEVNIVAAPLDLAVLDGRLASFAVVATGPDREYQWLRNGQPIDGAVQEVYSFAATTADNGARFSVRVSNDVHSVTSAEAQLTVVGTPGTDYATTVLQDAPVLYYRFEETAGTMAQNLGTLGAAADGTFSTAGLAFAQESAGPELGRALRFNVGHVEVPDLGLGQLEQLTVELWVNREGDPPDFYALFAAPGWTPGGMHFNIWSGDGAGARGEFAVSGNPSPWPRWSPGTIGRWYHWVVTYDVAAESRGLKVYVNGALVLVSETIASPIQLGGGRIGRWEDARPLHGLLDEFAIYTSVLTQEQVLRHYAAARVPDPIEQVELHYGLLPTGVLELYWPIPGLLLETTTDPAASESWTAVPDGTASPLQVPMQDAHRFYRLRQP